MQRQDPTHVLSKEILHMTSKLLMLSLIFSLASHGAEKQTSRVAMLSGQTERSAAPRANPPLDDLP
jgi:hypothetical protein